MRKDGTDTYVDLTRLPYIATSSYVGVPSRDKRRRPRISLHVTHLSTSTHLQNSRRVTTAYLSR
eukprot:scaffold2720_cov133-Skeletonema_dohrnii-CCMP3373.AAC.1